MNPQVLVLFVEKLDRIALPTDVLRRVPVAKLVLVVGLVGFDGQAAVNLNLAVIPENVSPSTDERVALGNNVALHLVNNG